MQKKNKRSRQFSQVKKFMQEFLKEKPFFFSLIRPKEASLYQEFAPFKKPVLDLGCGDGFFAEVAFGKLDAGIDPDKHAVKDARRRKIYRQLKPYNGKKIPYPDNYFKTIVCNSTYEHIVNLEEVLSETSRVLKKGGTLYFTTVSDRWPLYLFGRVILGVIYDRLFIKLQKHYNMYSLKTWRKVLATHGLTVIYETHYLDNRRVLWLFDIAHYVSAPSLITKKLFNTWVLFPGMVNRFNWLVDYLVTQTLPNTKKGSCLFIAAKKV